MPLYELKKSGQQVSIPNEDTSLFTFSFFIPCYNEEKNIGAVVSKLYHVCHREGVTFEILVFDDASKDNTVNAVLKIQNQTDDDYLRLFVNQKNQGMARNFIEGAFQARGKYYRIVMGDDVESEETLTSIIKQAGAADIVIPYHTEVHGRPAHRRLISRLYTRLVNAASNTNLRYYNGSPLFKRMDAIRFHVEATGMGFQAEFLLRLLQEGRSFVEIPVTASDREGSTSLNFRNFLSVGYSLFKILMRRISGAKMAR